MRTLTLLCATTAVALQPPTKKTPPTPPQRTNLDAAAKLEEYSTNREYWYDPRIHQGMGGNIGVGGLIASVMAPLITKVIDVAAYGGRDIRTDCAAAARSAVAAVDGLAAPVAPGAAPAASLVVDLGCGTAASTRGLRAAFPEADVLAYDTSPPFLRTARLLTNVVGGAKPVVFKERNAEATGLADGSADVVSIQFVLHEVPQQGRAALLAEAKRVLRPGGLLMVLDIAQEYSPSPAMAEGEPYVWGYMRNIKRDLSKAGFVSLEETKVVPNHATMWLCRTNIMPRPAGKNNILRINLGDAGLATKRRDAARGAIAAVAEAA